MGLSNVAVIGAGAAGLVAARELRREGHSVAVFERGTGVGGTWIYSLETESDVVHTSLYDSLRTNLPRESMGFFDYPFVAFEDGREGDSRGFPLHQEVLRHLEDFARDFEVLEVVRFRTEVMRVEMGEEGVISGALLYIRDDFSEVDRKTWLHSLCFLLFNALSCCYLCYQELDNL